MSSKLAPGDVQYGSGTILPDNPTLLAQGDTQNTARLQAGSDSFKLQMQKQYGAIQGAQPALDAMGSASDAASSVAKDNFNARMAEAKVRAQLHSSYMDLLWEQLKMKKNEDRHGKVGAALGAAAQISAAAFGGPVKTPVAGGSGGMESMMSLMGGKKDTSLSGFEASGFGDE